MEEVAEEKDEEEEEEEEDEEEVMTFVGKVVMGMSWVSPLQLSSTSQQPGQVLQTSTLYWGHGFNTSRVNGHTSAPYSHRPTGSSGLSLNPNVYMRHSRSEAHLNT